MKVTYMDENHQAYLEGEDTVLEAIAVEDPQTGEEFCKVVQYHPTVKRVVVEACVRMERDKVDIRVNDEEVIIMTPYDTIHLEVDW